jgi:hypothetical protein
VTALLQWYPHQDFAYPAAAGTARKTLAGIARPHGPMKMPMALPIGDLDLIVTALPTKCTLKAVRDNALLQMVSLAASGATSWH